MQRIMERDMSKHTPGPWTCQKSPAPHDGQHDFAIHAAKAKVLAEAFGRDCHGNIINAEANAKLIAAAPELLEALEHLVDQSDKQNWAIRLGGSLHPFDVKGAVQKARAAIAKAEGRAS